MIVPRNVYCSGSNHTFSPGLPTKQRRVMFIRNFTVHQTTKGRLQFGHTILSVLDNQLLIGQYNESRLFIYTTDGLEVARLPLQSDQDRLIDAVWTLRGRIAYTTVNQNVVIMSRAGDFISRNQIAKPSSMYFGGSANDAIYIVTRGNNILQLKEDDRTATWENAFLLPRDWYGEQVVRVASGANVNIQF